MGRACSTIGTDEHNILAGKPEQARPVLRSSITWDDNINRDNEKFVCGLGSAGSQQR